MNCAGQPHAAWLKGCCQAALHVLEMQKEGANNMWLRVAGPGDSQTGSKATYLLHAREEAQGEGGVRR